MSDDDGSGAGGRLSKGLMAAAALATILTFLGFNLHWGAEDTGHPTRTPTPKPPTSRATTKPGSVLWHGTIAVSTYAIDMDVTPPDRSSDDASRDLSLGFPFGGITAERDSVRWTRHETPTAEQCATLLETQGVAEQKYEGTGTRLCAQTTSGRTMFVELGKATKQMGGADKSVSVTATVWDAD